MHSIVTSSSTDYIYASDYNVVQEHLNNITSRACHAACTLPALY